MSKKKTIFSFVITALLFIVLLLYSIQAGSIKVSLIDLYNSTFFDFNNNSKLVYDLRFPRIIVAVIAGASIATSGTLLQAVMRNPMTDPGIIGISSASSLFALIGIRLFPQYLILNPLFAIAGGVIAYLLIYTLAWDSGARPLRLILVGIAINMTFMGLGDFAKSALGKSFSTTQSIIAGNSAQKTWEDVKILFIFAGIFLILSLFCAKPANLLNLEDKNAKSLGINVDRNRFLIAMVAVVLASVSTAVVGIIAFLGLIVPHIGRLLIGSNNKLLIPYSMLLGSSIFLFSDTLGRLIAYPYEISAGVMISIIGGPFFIVLLRLGGKDYGN